jgi:acetyltransferase-like isoleucine patch superfamily enzyme
MGVLVRLRLRDEDAAGTLVAMQKESIGNVVGGDSRSRALRLWHRAVGRVVAKIAETMPNPQGAWDTAEWAVTRWQDDVELGAFSYFNSTPRIHRYPNTDGQRVRIGKFCSLGKDVEFLLGGDHRTEWVTTFPLLEAFTDEGHRRTMKSRGEIRIGHDVWVGRGAFFRSGVTVGTGAVIGSRAVVTQDVRPYAIVAGNPAREVRRRFDDETVARLLASQWWELPVETIKEGVYILSSSDIGAFLRWIENLPSAERGAIDLREPIAVPERTDQAVG